MTVFVDSSAWYSALDAGDAGHVSTAELLRAPTRSVGWGPDPRGGVKADLEKASEIAAVFPDQRFSLVDRTSFAVMERLGITQAVSLDDALLVYRYGRDGRGAFEVLR